MSELSALDRVAALSALAGLEFAKGHGTGNDFVLIQDAEGQRELSAEAVAALCDRHLGVGGDGLIRAVHSANIAEGEPILSEAPDALWFMDYRNNDGSIAEMCGNGVRAFVHFLRVEGLVELPLDAQLRIGTRAGVKTVTRTADGYAVDMGAWTFIHPEEASERALDSLVTATELRGERPALSISMGNPHTVLALEAEAELDALDLNSAPLVTPQPAEGTNVEFVVPAEPLVHDGVGRVRMRVHERGVGETQSCGTGACAAAAAIRFWAGAQAPDSWQVSVPGGVVTVDFVAGPSGEEHVVLGGPAVLVSRGTLLNL